MEGEEEEVRVAMEGQSMAFLRAKWQGTLRVALMALPKCFI